MTSEQLLKQAAAIVARRRDIYGQPRDLFERAAARCSQVLGMSVTARQVILCLIDLKVARLCHDPQHFDSITDIAGYAAILAELLDDA